MSTSTKFQTYSYYGLAATELTSGMTLVDEFPVGNGTLRMFQSHNSLLAFFGIPQQGGFALRTAYSPKGILSVDKQPDGSYRVETESGFFDVSVAELDERSVSLRAAVKFTPSQDIEPPYWERDFQPVAGEEALFLEGQVEAAQRGMNSGLCYFNIKQPNFGAVLYAQNLTALNDYFLATGTKPDGAVGGEWPVLGYKMPTKSLDSHLAKGGLKAGTEYMLSDALIACQPQLEIEERSSALQFIVMLATLYPHLDKPEPAIHDWQNRAQRTMRDLAHAPEATIEHYGHTYVHPYVDAEYPDSMVQLTILTSLSEYVAETGNNVPLVEKLRAGVDKFYDPEIGTIRRYLPNVGDDKNADAVDSWYVCHPLMNLALLAAAGDEGAKELFLNSIDYVIKGGQHFKYRFPIQYNVKTFDVIDLNRKEEDNWGQTDANGLYAYVMLQAHELTGEQRFVEEARTAMDATKGDGFELAYQTNLTAWGALACAKLAVIDKNDQWMNQSYVFLASLMHNCVLWDSKLGNAKDMANFFGVTCLHDAPYMAMFETFEIYNALNQYLEVGGDKIAPSARLLVEEFIRYAPDNAWYFYPDALPEEAIATKIRESNGHIDRGLSFPLEDLYVDGQPAGQVGQEIYGAGAAFVFALHELRAERALDRQPRKALHKMAL